MVRSGDCLKVCTVPKNFKTRERRLSNFAIAPLLFLALSQCVVLARNAKTMLHRVDMQVEGSSCASCLIRLEKKIRAEKGVLKVVVSIYRPYKSAVVYDPAQTNWQLINRALESEKVTAAHFTDTAINEIPLVLQPK